MLVKTNQFEVELGTYKYISLPVCSLANGEPLNIPLHVISGKREGPRLVVISTQHGDEIGPISVIHRLIQDIDPEKLAGTLLMVPVANPLAFEKGQRATWFDALYNATTGNLNRIWPGKPDGFLSERIAYCITENVLSGADCVIDMHGSTTGSISIYYSFVVTDDTELGQWTRELNIAFGMEIMVRWPGYPGTTLHNYVYDELGIPSIPVELGDFYGLFSERLDEQLETPVRTVPEVGVTGVINVMKKMRMLDGQLQLPTRQVIISPEQRCLPAAGGLMFAEVGMEHIGLRFPKGYVFGRVVNAVTFEELDIIRAPFEQNLLLSARNMRPVSKVNAGDQSFHVGDLSTAEWLENERRFL